MVDATALRAWIQEQHLSEERLAAYREAFQEHPAHLVVLEDYLQPDAADRLAKFLASEASFSPEYGVADVEGAGDEATWEGRKEDERFFRYRRLTGIPPEHMFSPNAMSYLKFRKNFQEDPYRQFFEAVSGVPLSASDDFGAHRMEPGDYMRDHSDDNRDRRLALVIYLTPDWRPEYGGALRMTDKHGDVTIVEPRYNSMVVFDVMAGSEHQVETVQAAVGDGARLTIGGWYHREGAGT
jgi:hypothetical protein